jgi:hypothetical protein
MNLGLTGCRRLLDLICDPGSGQLLACGNATARPPGRDSARQPTCVGMRRVGHHTGRLRNPRRGVACKEETGKKRRLCPVRYGWYGALLVHTAYVLSAQGEPGSGRHTRTAAPKGWETDSSLTCPRLHCVQQ